MYFEVGNKKKGQFKLLPVVARIRYGGSAYVLVPQYRSGNNGSNVLEEQRTEITYRTPLLNELIDKFRNQRELEGYDWVFERDGRFIDPQDNEEAIALLRPIE